MTDMEIDDFGLVELTVGTIVFKDCPGFADCLCCLSLLSNMAICSLRSKEKESETLRLSLVYRVS